jgi:hypothetical protein
MKFRLICLLSNTILNKELSVYRNSKFTDKICYEIDYYINYITNDGDIKIAEHLWLINLNGKLYEFTTLKERLPYLIQYNLDTKHYHFINKYNKRKNILKDEIYLYEVDPWLSTDNYLKYRNNITTILKNYNLENCVTDKNEYIL